MEDVELNSFTGGEQAGEPASPTPEPADAESAEDGGEEDDGSDEYGTPRWLIRRLTATGKFDLDATAGAEPFPIARLRYTKEDDALSQPWTRPDIDSIYLNPPYSDPYPFLRRLKHAVDPDDPEAADYAVSLTKSDTSTGWFHDHLTEARVLCFLSSRLSFHGADDDANFPNVIGIFGDPPEHLLETISDLGELYTRVEVNTALEQQRLDDLITDGGAAATAIPVTASTPNTPPTPSHVELHGKYTTLDFVKPHDVIEMSFETDSLGSYYKDVPEEVELVVIPQGKDIDPDTGSIVIDTIGKTPDGTDVCARLKNSAEIASHLEVSLAVGMGRWDLVTPKSVAVNP